MPMRMVDLYVKITEVTLLSIASKLFAGVLRPPSAYEGCMHENEAGFRPSSGCTDHMFTLRQIQVHMYAFRRLRIAAFLELKAALSPVGRAVWWNCLSLKDIPEEFTPLIQSLLTRSGLGAYGDVSPEFSTRIDVPWRCAFSLFPSNFVTEVIILITLSPCENNGVDT